MAHARELATVGLSGASAVTRRLFAVSSVRAEDVESVDVTGDTNRLLVRVWCATGIALSLMTTGGSAEVGVARACGSSCVADVS